MTKADIQAALAKDPRTEFAVKVPRFEYGRKVESSLVRARISFDARGYVTLDANPTTVHPKVDGFRTAAVLDTWSNHTINQLHATALYMDRQRDDRIAYEAQRAARTERIEKFLPAFAGIKVQPGGTANVPREDVDLSDRLRETFVEGGAHGSMFTAEDFEAIAERIDALSRQLLDAASGWSNGGFVTAEDTGVPEVDPIDAARARVAVLDPGPVEDEYEQGYRQGVQDALDQIAEQV